MVAQCPTISMSSTDITCNGSNDGTAMATLVGGSGNYSYDWSTGATTAAVTGLLPGTHYVNVTDITLNCNLFGLVEISEPNELTVSPTSTPVGCSGGNDGTASANVSGGTSPFIIIWSNGQIGPIATGLTASSYTVTVTDANNCSTFGSVTVGTSSSFLVEFDSVQHVSCAGFSDGAVLANASGGSGVYEYLWNTGDTIAAIDSLITGVYSVAVSDTNGCVALDSIFISEPTILAATIIMEQATSCFNTCNGIASAQAIGGTSPYNYLWDANTGSQSGPTAINLCPDTFIVSVSDANNCAVLTSAIITAPDTIVLNDSIIDARCYGSSDAGIFTEVLNAVYPLSYQWADSNYILSQTGQDLLNIPAGVYYVNIVDSLGCELRDTFLVDHPAPLTTELIVTDATCNGSADGAIQQLVTGGTAPYQFLWSDGDSIEDRTGLTAGTYAVLITDTNDCIVEDSAIVHEPNPLIINALINDVSCIQQSDGAISVQAEGGNGSYQYSWNTGDSGDEIVGLPGGAYTVTTMDALGCLEQEAFEVLVSNEECINIPSAFTPNSDGLNDTWILRNIELYPGNSVKILNRWGLVVHESSNYNEPWDGRYNGDDLPSGTYYYVVNLNDGNSALTGPVTLVR